MKKHIRNFLILSTLTTITICGINKLISITSTMKKILKTDHGRFFQWKYGNIYYTKTGKGSPVLLIHDLEPASSSLEWEKISKSLSKNHTVYSLDLLGCGRSDKPNLTYTNYLYVQMITDFVKNIIHDKTSLISMGAAGSFSVMACNMEPEYFDKIILVNPENLNYLMQTPDKKKNALKFLIDMPIFGTFIYNIIYSNSMVEKLFYKKYFHSYFYDENIKASYYEAAHLDNSRGKYLLSSLRANYTNINISHALEKINNSIYLICSKDNADSENIIESYRSYNSSIESAYINHSKYLPQIEAPEQLLQYLTLFLDSSV